MVLDIQICMIPCSHHSEIYVTNAKSTQILLGCHDNRSLGHLRVRKQLLGTSYFMCAYSLGGNGVLMDLNITQKWLTDV